VRQISIEFTMAWKQNKFTEVSMEYHFKITSSQMKTAEQILWKTNTPQKD